jgi:hypothetical protein
MENINIDSIYDFKNRRFKSIVIPVIIFIGSILVTFILGAFFDVPTMILFSFFAFALSLAALLHDHRVLNSLVNQLWPVFLVIVIDDVMNGSTGAIGHLITAIFSFIVSFRHNSSLFLMLIATVFYGLWVYTISRWTTYYDCSSWFCNPVTEMIMMFIGCGLTSFAITVRDYFSCVAHSPDKKTAKDSCKVMIK